MDFQLSPDQLALKDGASDLLDSLSGPAAVRAVVGTGGGCDERLWSAMADQGWMAVEVPEDEGGLGLGLVEVAVLCEQVGRYVAPAPFRCTILALGALRAAQRSGAVPEADELVERLSGGEARACVAWSARAGSVTATSKSGDWYLSGRPDPVLYAPLADVAVVLAHDDDGPALFLVEFESDTRDGSMPRPPAEAVMDRTRVVGWLDLDDTTVVRLGGRDEATALADRGATLASAELLGGADRILEMSVAYAKDRVQFGRPIGSFQAVKHRLADMLVDVEGMRSTAYYAAWAVGAAWGSNGPTGVQSTDASPKADASIAASVAKTWCSDASRRVMASGLQVHGGIGFTWEHDLHLYLKRSQLDQVSFGDADFHRERLARLLKSRVEAGQSVV